MYEKRFIKLLSLLLALSLLLCGCGAAKAESAVTPDPEAEEKGYRLLESMDTIIELTAYGSNREAALDAAAAEVERLNDLLSIGLEDSEVSRLNWEGSAALSADTAYLIDRALQLFDSTGGAFDPTVYPLMVLWGFTSGEHHVPTAEEISQLLYHAQVMLLAKGLALEDVYKHL